MTPFQNALRLMANVAAMPEAGARARHAVRGLAAMHNIELGAYDGSTTESTPQVRNVLKLMADVAADPDHADARKAVRALAQMHGIATAKPKPKPRPKPMTEAEMIAEVGRIGARIAELEAEQGKGAAGGTGYCSAELRERMLRLAGQTVPVPDARETHGSTRLVLGTRYEASLPTDGKRATTPQPTPAPAPTPRPAASGGQDPEAARALRLQMGIPDEGDQITSTPTRLVIGQARA